jgi:hypothetical protein
MGKHWSAVMQIVEHTTALSQCENGNCTIVEQTDNTAVGIRHADHVATSIRTT